MSAAASQRLPGVASWALIVGLVSTGGCSAYGWAGRPAETRLESEVPVRTVDVDAHAATDAGKLTRDFVDELRTAGIANAVWSGAADDGAVACDVSIADDESFADRGFARASARCRVGEELVGRRDATSQLALDPNDRTLGRRRAAESAARRSLELVARDVARHLVAVRATTN